jgi:hypothetical protein
MEIFSFIGTVCSILSLLVSIVIANKVYKINYKQNQNNKTIQKNIKAKKVGGRDVK